MLEEFEDNPFLPRFYEDQQRYAFSVELSFLAQRYHQLKRVGERSLFESQSPWLIIPSENRSCSPR